MRSVGRRIQFVIDPVPSGHCLTAGARFGETIGLLADSMFIPKGVYRFRSQVEANIHWRDCLAQAMARRAMNRT